MNQGSLFPQASTFQQTGMQPSQSSVLPGLLGESPQLFNGPSQQQVPNPYLQSQPTQKESNQFKKQLTQPIRPLMA